MASRFHLRVLLGLLLNLGLISFAGAADRCHEVRFSDVGWTDITANTALVRLLLDGLGYQTKTMQLSVPVTYVSLKNKDIDVFLGNWMPTMAADIQPYQKEGSVDTVGRILDGARYTLAVPHYVAQAGVKSVADLSRFKDRFKARIYAVEPGNDGNRLIQKMITDGKLNLQGWKLVESSEQAMLMEVKRAVQRKEWVVFLGWEPHPMNRKFELTYLDGADDYFGPHQGRSHVYVNTRRNYTQECVQVGKLLKNLNFSLEMENTLMSYILDEGMEPKAAAVKWIKQNPTRVSQWLSGIQARDGSDGYAALRKAYQL